MQLIKLTQLDDTMVLVNRSKVSNVMPLGTGTIFKIGQRTFKVKEPFNDVAFDEPYTKGQYAYLGVSYKGGNLINRLMMLAVDDIEYVMTSTDVSVFLFMTGGVRYTATGDLDYILTVANANTNPDGIIKRFAVALTQVGADDPTVTVIFNTIGYIDIVRTAAGTYTLTRAGAFPVGKSIPLTVDSFTDEAGNKYVLTPTSADVYTLETYAAADLVNPADGVLNNRYLLIEIYS